MKVGTVVESEIVELLRESELCPVCQAIAKATDGWIYGAFYNLLHNETARDKLKKGGLCRIHARRITELAREKSDIGNLSVSIVFREILAEQLRNLKGSRRSVRLKKRSKSERKGCHLCEVSEETESRYLKGFASFFDSDGVRSAYEISSTVFCIDHARALLTFMKLETSEWFVPVQRKKLESLLSMLKLYIEKKDYKNDEPIGSEKNAWLLASKIIGRTEG